MYSNIPLPDFQDNIKILRTRKENNYQFYKVLDNETGFTFTTRAVTFKNPDEIGQLIDSDYCEWYRQDGKTELKQFYKNQ